MQAIKNFFTWVIFSSKDSERVSLTVKGFLIGAAAVAAHFFPGADFSPVIQGAATFVQEALTIVSTAVFLYGAIRKLWTTLNGNNAVISDLNG